MADTTTSVLTAPLQNLYDIGARQAFTQRGQFYRIANTNGHIADVQMGPGSRGKAAIFDIWSSTTAATTPLSENSDGTATSLATTQVTVTLKEYGNYTHTTRKLRDTAYGSIEAQAAWMMGDDAGRALDLVARDILDAQTGATWVAYGTGGTTAASSVATITKGNELTADDVRKAWAKLRKNNVPALEGGYYMAYIHPDVLKDLKDETGNASWTVKELYQQERLNPIRDEYGIFEGFRFVITTTAKLNSKAGNGTTTSAASADVYTTYFVGQDALGFASASQVPEVKIGNPFVNAADVYGRFQTIGWYALAGFAALRANSLFKIYSASSLGANGA